ncbi:MAG: SurA N-terminal domain-containing protein [Patescibacteria group bacterium]
MDNFSEASSPEERKSPAGESASTAPATAGEGKQISIKISRRAVKIAAVVLAVGAAAFFAKGLFVAAIVNGHIISRFAVISELEKSSGKGALAAIITRKLIDDEVAKKGITATPEEVSAEIKKIDERLKSQGQTLAAALMAEGMTEADLEKQISSQKKLENLLADKTQVTDDEVAQYIKDNKITVPKSGEADLKVQIKNQLQQQKMGEASSALIESLRAAAAIRYFVDYGK